MGPVGARASSAARSARVIADAAVVGAGVIGASTALALARRGHSVCVIDKNRGAGLGSTSYSSGVCRQFYSVKESVQFAWEGYHFWEQWRDFVGVRDDRGYASLRETGGLIFDHGSSRDFLETTTAHCADVGVPFDRLSRLELEAHYGPASPFRMCLDSFGPPTPIDDPRFGEVSQRDCISGAVFFPKTGYVSDPKLAVDNLRLAAEATGRCTFAFGQPVTGVTLDGGRMSGLTLSDGTRVSAPIVVNAAGPHSAEVTSLVFSAADAPPNDMVVWPRPLRQEVAYVTAPPGIDYESSGPAVCDLDAGVYFRPEVGNKILIGSVEPECDPLEWVDTVDEASPALSSVHTTHIMRLAMRLPELELPSAASTQGIVACYDATPDWTPIYDRSSIPGFYLAVGTSGNQFKNAGIVGELMAQLVDRCESGVDQDRNPLRLELTRSGAGTINTARFSRLRDPHSGANVLG